MSTTKGYCARSTKPCSSILLPPCRRRHNSNRISYDAASSRRRMGPFGSTRFATPQYTMNAPSFSDSTIRIRPHYRRHQHQTHQSFLHRHHRFLGAYGSAGYEWTNYESLPCNPVDTGTTTAGTVLSNWIFGAFTGLLGLLRAYIQRALQQ